MTTQIKYLIFKGIEKKEEILFKSFLNLAKNELDYQVVILKPDTDDQAGADIVIADTEFEFESNEEDLKNLPTIWIGDDIENDAENYIQRPAQWSDFKAALSNLDVELVTDEEEPAERVLPKDIKFAITDMPGDVEVDSEDQEDDSETDDYEYELEKLSIDYHSVTNSDYAKAADDVKQFHVDNDEATPADPVILVTDDESASQNSVLVIETNTVDAWDFTQSEATLSEVNGEYKGSDDAGTDEDVVLEKKAGFEIPEGEQYWNEDNEIIVNNETLLYFKPLRAMVYSAKEPGRWGSILKEGEITKLPLKDDWRPTRELRAYPMQNFEWVNTLVNHNSTLNQGLDEETEYMLEKWPDFDLIQLDNTLLKLCTMLFVRPESLTSLILKSGYDRSVIVGLMNACDIVQLIKPSSQFAEQEIQHSNDSGMLGKIKDVFR